MNIEQINAQMRSFSSWEDKYRFIIQLGKQLPLMDERVKKTAFEVKGCESQVWLNWQYNEGKYHFQADSDARIVKGLIAIVFAAVEGKNHEEIANFNFENYFNQLDLLGHLSVSRSNGINAIVSTIKSVVGSSSL